MYTKVQINFLPVGHTHEDIDQLFSKISETIRHNGCESLPGVYNFVEYQLATSFCILIDLLQKINGCYKPNPQSQLLDGVLDFKDWMKPFLGTVENHSKYHAFRFTKKSPRVWCKSSLQITGCHIATFMQIG